MNFSIRTKAKPFEINPDKALDISIPLNFNGQQPNAYGVGKATSTPCKAGDLVGDTRAGGSCNFEEYKFIPHCNGTHTECIGHITKERISVRNCLLDVLSEAVLISAEPEPAEKMKDTYPAELNEQDKVITRRSILNGKWNMENSEALIIRTFPNDKSKLTQQYGQENIPPFLSNEAMELIVDLGIKHLLVDLPSIDRIFDEGKLSNHRIFWKVAEGEFELNEKSRINSTVTELIYVPDEIPAGHYLLNLQIAPFESDVSPSRPVLFEIK